MVPLQTQVHDVFVNPTFLHPKPDSQVPAETKGSFNQSAVTRANIKTSVSKNAGNAWESVKSGSKRFSRFTINLAKDVGIFVSTVGMKTAAFALAGGVGGFIAGGVVGLCTVPPTVTITAPAGGLIGMGAGAATGAVYGCYKGWKAVKKRRANMRKEQQQQAEMTQKAQQQSDIETRLKSSEKRNEELLQTLKALVEKEPAGKDKETLDP